VLIANTYLGIGPYTVENVAMVRAKLLNHARDPVDDVNAMFTSNAGAAWLNA
jgi:hypothetical protein